MKSLADVMLAMAKNANGGEVHVALPKEKRAVSALEKKGLVTVRRTDEKTGPYTDWWFAAFATVDGAS